MTKKYIGKYKLLFVGMSEIKKNTLVTEHVLYLELFG